MQCRSPGRSVPKRTHNTHLLLCLGLILSGNLLFPACSSGSSTVTEPAEAPGDEQPDTPPDTDPIPGAAELRAVLQRENVGTPPAAPEVSDELFTLGQALFFDKLLSGNRDISCATCHWPELATDDDLTLPRGVGGVGLGQQRTGGAIVPRNSPTVLATHGLRRIFWDGRVERDGATLRTPAGAQLTQAMRDVFDPRWELLAAQAMFPPTSRDEMRGEAGQNELADVGDADFQGIWSGLTNRLVAIPTYQQMFLAAYPSLTSVGDIQFAHAANAMAAFEARAFSPTDSRLSRFINGDERALSAAEVQGGLEFFDQAGCARCHGGTRFTDQNFHNIGLPQLGPGKGDGIGGREDFGRERVTGQSGDRYEFRTPSLLNVELTAPYGHAGQYATLLEFVRHYTNPTQRLREYDVHANVADPEIANTLVANQEQVLQNLDRRVRGDRRFDVEAVAAFLRSLTAESARDLSGWIPAGVPSGLSLR